MVVIDGVEMVDVHEAADLVRRTPETVRRWVWSGRIAAVKKGQKLFVSRQQLLVASGAQAPARSERLTLSAWAEELRQVPTSGSRATARELVLDDRAGR